MRQGSLQQDAVAFEEPSTKPGRPPEDRFRRREEIFRAIAPAVLEDGAAGMTVRRLARLANVSVGTLYRYFDSKVDLLTFPLQDASCAEQLRRFEARHRGWSEGAPERYVLAFLDEMVATFPLLRASFAAALELGSEGFREAMDDAIGGELEERLAALVRTRGDGFDAAAVARSLKRAYLGALLDRTVHPAELRRDLVAILG